MSWENHTIEGFIHVVPVNDLRPHDIDQDCWCEPFTDHEEQRIAVHNSLDLREQYENGRLMS